MRRFLPRQLGEVAGLTQSPIAYCMTALDAAVPLPERTGIRGRIG